MKSIKNLVITSVFLFGSNAMASAQAHSVEVAAGGGYAHYSDTATASYLGNSASANASSSKGKFDASVSYNALDNLAIGFEYTYSKLNGSSSSGGYCGTTCTTYNDNVTDKLNNYGGVVRYGFGHHALQPYVLGAGGVARVTDSETLSTYTGSTSYTSSLSTSNTGGYFGFGGGLNARFGHFGVRPEVRYERLAFSTSVQGVSVKDRVNEVDVTGSVFYTFGGTHHHPRR